MLSGDEFAVTVLKTDEIVSHLPRRISSLCSSSVSESKRTDSEPSLAAIQHFTFTIMYVRTYVRVLKARCACVRTQRNHAHNNLNFCEENFRDQKANHENSVPRKFRAIRYSSEV